MTTSPRSQIIAVGDLGWQEFQPGITFKVLWQDPATKRRAQMTRFAPGAQLPLHRHAGDELIFVIEGAVSDESGTVTRGERQLPSRRLRPHRHLQERRDGAGRAYRRYRACQRPRKRAAIAGFHAERPAVDRGAPGRPTEADLGGQGDRAPRASGAFRTGGDAPAASSRWRRADLSRRRRECGRIGRRRDRPDELPPERVRPHGHDPERRYGARRRLGAHGACLIGPDLTRPPVSACAKESRPPVTENGRYAIYAPEPSWGGQI